MFLSIKTVDTGLAVPLMKLLVAKEELAALREAQLSQAEQALLLRPEEGRRVRPRHVHRGGLVGRRLRSGGRRRRLRRGCRWLRRHPGMQRAEEGGKTRKRDLSAGEFEGTGQDSDKAM